MCFINRCSLPCSSFPWCVSSTDVPCRVCLSPDVFHQQMFLAVLSFLFCRMSREILQCGEGCSVWCPSASVSCSVSLFSLILANLLIQGKPCMQGVRSLSVWHVCWCLLLSAVDLSHLTSFLVWLVQTSSVWGGIYALKKTICPPTFPPWCLWNSSSVHLWLTIALALSSFETVPVFISDWRQP